MIRYSVGAGALITDDNGSFVSYDSAMQEIHVISLELRQARAQLVTLEHQRQADIARKDKIIETLRVHINNAVRELGYGDD